jgi:hypothetical protein
LTSSFCIRALLQTKKGSGGETEARVRTESHRNLCLTAGALKPGILV